MSPSISRVLIANRGEIVVRICRTLARRGIRSVVVYTPDDAAAAHVECGDLAVPVGRYLDPNALLAAAKVAGADAVHPGYGFLSEDAGFARDVVDAGLVWIGPPPQAIEQMGDKIEAKRTVAAAGVPVVPGTDRSGMTDDDIEAAAVRMGLPVLLKPAAGGGGKGMHRVRRLEELRPAIAAARREAAGAFGDDTLLVERWISRPRHVEVQVFADAHGHVVHLGERECSLQRRHQKIVEESPSPLLDEPTRQAMAASAINVACSCGYVGAGTVEFIVSGDRPDEYFFMEMNTRLQVEHPVTEMVTGIDLVDWQLRVAAGEALPVRQEDITCSGNAIEVRVYAEDPRRDFLPATGTIQVLHEPAGRAGVRVDSALTPGLAIGTGYDPMLAKIIGWGQDRHEALQRVRAALRATAILGVTTNLGHLHALLGHPDVVAGRLDTELVERTVGALTAAGDADRTAAIVAACRVVADLQPAGPNIDPWDVPDGWRVGVAAPVECRFQRGGRSVVVAVRGSLSAAVAVVDEEAPIAVGARPTGDRLLVTIDGVTTRWHAAATDGGVWVGRDGEAWRFGVEQVERTKGQRARATDGRVTSPMPGSVVEVHVTVGDQVTAGQPLVAVEAMKMEHIVTAPVDGEVTAVPVRAGQAVALDQVLAEITVDEGHGDG